MNTYPTVRGFTAIGTGGDDFVQAMVVAVESVIQQPIPQVCLYINTFFLKHINNFSEIWTYLFGAGLLIYVVIVLSATTSFYTREI